MTTKASGSFQVTAWDEDAYYEGEDRKLTNASVGQSFDGDIRGDGTARWLMAYRPDGTARFVGLQLVDAEIAGRRGTVVFETSGEFDGQVARWDAVVVLGSGTQDLAGASGRGTFEAPFGSAATFELDLDLATR